MHMDSKCINKENASISCIEYLPRTFNSADQTENYDSDDSVGYEETFSWINVQVNVKLWNNLHFWVDETNLTMYWKQVKDKPKLELQNIK